MRDNRWRIDGHRELRRHRQRNEPLIENRPMDWEPMHTAPRDGDEIDLWVVDLLDSRDNKRWTDCVFDGDVMEFCQGRTILSGPRYRPTHWM